ncbi:MAG: hypothetical protein AMXMBFR7_47600 [Planctomycetota bacterium]
MSANVIIENAGVVDKRATQLRAMIIVPVVEGDESSGTTTISSDYWTVQYVEIEKYGAEPAEARISIRTNAGELDHRMNTVAFNPDGPMKDLLLGRRMAIAKVVKGKFENYSFIGKIVDVAHDKDNDGLSVRLLDDRYDLEEVRIKGRYVRDPQTGYARFEMGEMPHFNPGGRPNCIFDANGKPCFSVHPDYGRAADAPVPDPDTRPTDVATNWTIGFIFEYFRTHYGPDFNPESEDGLVWPWLPHSPAHLEWPETFASNLDTYSIFTFDAAVGQYNHTVGFARKGRDMAVDGLALLDVMDRILKTAGGWAVNVRPAWSQDGSGIDRWTAVLEAVSTRYERDGISIPFAAGGNAKTTFATPVVSGGHYNESARNIATQIVGCGDRVMIERRASSAGGDIIRCWTFEEFEGFRRFWGEMNEPDALGLIRAGMKYPKVLCAWRINPTWNFLEGTSFENFPRTQKSRPIFPQLLSWLSGAEDFSVMRLPLRVEVLTAGGWTTSFEGNQYEVWDDGTIYIPQLRMEPLNERPGSWRWNGEPFDASVADPYDIVEQQVRMTLAIPADYRLSASVGMPHHTHAGYDFKGVLTGLPDQDRIDPSLKRTQILDLGNLYRLWLRKNSWPYPESLPGTEQAVDRTSREDALATDEELLTNHVKRTQYELGRLQKNGVLHIDGWLVDSYRAGQAVKELIPIGIEGRRPMPVRTVISKVSWKVDRGNYKTEIHLE